MKALRALPRGPWPIEITELSRHFVKGGVRIDVLRGVDLRLEPGEKVAVIGQSGAGKTHLPARSWARLDRAARARQLPQRDHRLRVPVPSPARRVHGPRERHDARPSSAASPTKRPASGQGTCSTPSASATGCTTGPASSRAANSSGWRSPARWSAAPRCCWPTSPPATSTQRPRSRSSTC
jgi:hypothetical protein